MPSYTREDAHSPCPLTARFEEAEIVEVGLIMVKRQLVDGPSTYTQSGTMTAAEHCYTSCYGEYLSRAIQLLHDQEMFTKASQCLSINVNQLTKIYTADIGTAVTSSNLRRRNKAYMLVLMPAVPIA